MFFWNKFCGLLLLFFILINFSYAQTANNTITTARNNSLNFSISFSNKTEIPGSKLSFLNIGNVENKYLIYQKMVGLPLENFNSVSSSALPGNFSTCKYGFFCRQELKIEKATNFPIRIRLGSLEQCNYYEGKP